VSKNSPKAVRPGRTAPAAGPQRPAKGASGTGDRATKPQSQAQSQPMKSLPAEASGKSASEGRASEGRGRRAAPPPQGQVWLWGLHPVAAALANPERTSRRLLVTAEGRVHLETELGNALVGRHFPSPEIVTREEIDSRLPAGAVHQGMALLAESLPALGIEDLNALAATRDPASQSIVVALDQVTDPHNVGAILRSAAAFGALAVLVPDRNAPEETGTLAKSASGALERVPLVRVTNLVRALEGLQGGGFWTVGLAAEAERTLAGLALTGKIVLVLGSEGEGLRRLTREHCDHLAKLPMPGGFESLNVSNAAAISLYELNRA